MTKLASYPKALIEGNPKWKNTFDGRQTLIEDTFEGQQPLLEDNFLWRTTFDERLKINIP